MSHNFTREQEESNYAKEVLLHGKNATRRSYADNTTSIEATTCTSGLIVRARFHTQRDWKIAELRSLDDAARFAVDSLIEWVTPEGTARVWMVHDDGASFPVMDFEDIMAWVEESSVIENGGEDVMDLVVYDYDPTERVDVERFEPDKKTKKKMKWKGRKIKCAVM